LRVATSNCVSRVPSSAISADFTLTVTTESSSALPAVDLPSLIISLFCTCWTPSTPLASWTSWSACAGESTKPLRSTWSLRVSTLVSLPLLASSVISAVFTLVVMTASSSAMPAVSCLSARVSDRLQPASDSAASAAAATPRVSDRAWLLMFGSPAWLAVPELESASALPEGDTVERPGGPG
jgi:hypothetical protein